MKEIQQAVMTDGEATLGVWISDGIGPGAFGLVMSDGGGYSSLMIRPSDWDEIKTKVDALLAEHLPNAGTVSDGKKTE